MPRTAQERGIGQRIATWRSQRNLSQGVVAGRAGVHPSYLSRIENGKVHPTVRTALRIAEAMEVSLSDLVGPSPALQDRPCPLTTSGSCMVDLIDPSRELQSSQNGETYSPAQVRLLRRFLALLRQSDPPLLRALDVVLAEMLGGSTVGGSASGATRKRRPSARSA